MQQIPQEKQLAIIYSAKTVVILSLFFVCCGLIFLSAYFLGTASKSKAKVVELATSSNIAQSGAAGAQLTDLGKTWTAPPEEEIPAGASAEAIRYGRELIANTGKYFGPNGKIAAISNGMNCQNCHLNAGTKLYANNYSIFFANYPKKGARSGKTDQVTDRISDCFQRSLNGQMPDRSSKEIQAMIAYFKWVGQGQKKGGKPEGTATEKIPYLDRAADPKKGLLVYRKQCQSCHGEDGAGQKAQDQLTYIYPPLWGENSYNDGAGMYRLSNFAGFVKNNMPYGVDHKSPVLKDEEAWDVAAYVNSRPRPHREQRKDYPDLSRKPIDAPYGPYPDPFPAVQHKYGPFKPIVAYSVQLRSKPGTNQAQTRP